MVSIKGLSKPAVLAALFNSSKQQGMGFLDLRGASRMSEQDAEKVISEQGHAFDYLRGRVMKVDIEADHFYELAYDRDNGQGAAARAIEQIQVKLAA